MPDQIGISQTHTPVSGLIAGYNSSNVATFFSVSNTGSLLTAGGSVVANANNLGVFTSVTKGSAIPSPSNGNKAVSAKVVGSGAVSGEVWIYGTHENSNSIGILLGKIILSGTSPVVDGFPFDANWSYLFANCISISGSSTLTVTVGG